MVVLVSFSIVCFSDLNLLISISLLDNSRSILVIYFNPMNQMSIDYFINF